MIFPLVTVPINIDCIKHQKAIDAAEGYLWLEMYNHSKQKLQEAMDLLPDGFNNVRDMIINDMNNLTYLEENNESVSQWLRAPQG